MLLSLDHVHGGEDGEACTAVMDLLAVLSAAGVRRVLVHAAAEEGLPGRGGPLPALAPEAADRVLARLAGTSLLTFSLDGSAVTAHRLVMRVIRENLAADDAMTAVCESAARLLDGLAESRWQNWYEDRAATRDLVEQIMALDESAARCPPGGDLDRHLLLLQQKATGLLNLLGDSAVQAIVIGERLVAASERVLGPDHPDTLTSRNNLAYAYRDAGRLDEAITLHEQTLAARERVLGPDHPNTLTSRSNLANAYRAVGRLDEAISLNEQTLAARERVLGPDHPGALTSRNNLANAYRDAGRLDEAISLLEQVLAARDRVLGPDHPDTLQSRNNLAVAYRAAGRLDEAISLLEQVLAARDRVLGPDHPDTLQSRNNLAVAYRAAGRLDEAISLSEQTLAVRERVLGSDHPDTRTSRRNLASAYRAVGRENDARAAEQRLLGLAGPTT